MDQVGGKVEGETSGIGVHLGGQYGNLAQYKLPGIYESDPSEDP